MDTWSLPKARPISCNDCPAFQRLHMSVRCVTESFTRLRCVINTTFRKKIYNRWCCIDRLSWQEFSGCGKLADLALEPHPDKLSGLGPPTAEPQGATAAFRCGRSSETISKWP